jgi:putative transposase
VAPRRRRFGLSWAQYPHNIRCAEVLRFLKALRRHIPSGFTLLWDRHRPHRAKNVQTWLAARKRIVVEWLPPYAPDLNPVECVWSHTKYGDLANFAPDCLRTLEHAVVTSLSQTRSRRDLFEGFFHGAGL